MRTDHFRDQDDKIKHVAAKLKDFILAQKVSANELTAALFLLKANLAALSAKVLDKEAEELIKELDIFRNLGYID